MKLMQVHIVIITPYTHMYVFCFCSDDIYIKQLRHFTNINCKDLKPYSVIKMALRHAKSFLLNKC